MFPMTSDPRLDPGDDAPTTPTRVLRVLIVERGGAIETSRASDAAARELHVTFPPGGIVWADLEKGLIEQALAQNGGNQVRAAKLLGLSRDAFRYRMQKYGLATRRDDEPKREAFGSRVGR